MLKQTLKLMNPGGGEISYAARPALRPNQPPLQWLLALS